MVTLLFFNNLYASLPKIILHIIQNIYEYLLKVKSFIYNVDIAIFVNVS